MDDLESGHGIVLLLCASILCVFGAVVCVPTGTQQQREVSRKPLIIFIMLSFFGGVLNLLLLSQFLLLLHNYLPLCRACHARVNEK